jgi:DNA-binding NarL/FixJ family response regulator
MALLLFFLKWLELRFVIIDHALELYVGAVAVVFTGLGIWLALKVVRPKVKVIEREVYVNGTHPVLNEKTRADLNLSKRELEVLQLMADGLSNKEIADRLFVSLSTVKTHSNNLFDKMNVERRTQAIDKARRLGIIL